MKVGKHTSSEDFGLRTPSLLNVYQPNYFPSLHLTHIEKIVFLIKTESHGI